jgi:hypothetical protein
MVDKFLNTCRGYKRRRATAEIYSANVAIMQKVTLLIHLGMHSLNGHGQMPKVSNAKKIAVGADASAERYVKI